MTIKKIAWAPVSGSIWYGVTNSGTFVVARDKDDCWFASLAAAAGRRPARWSYDPTVEEQAGMTLNIMKWVCQQHFETQVRSALE